MSGVILDTCAIIWLAEGAQFSPGGLRAIDEAAAGGESVSVSPISAWEIGIQIRQGRLRTTKSAQSWFDDFMARSGFIAAPMPVPVLVGSSFLPGDPPADPADRIIAATAREFGLTLVTRDRALLQYADAGHLNAIEC